MTRTIVQGSPSLALNPIGDLAPTWVATPSQFRSVGVDGYIYGRLGTGANPETIVRSGDALATIEQGAVITVTGSQRIIWAGRTTDGYVVVVSDYPVGVTDDTTGVISDTGAIWFSTTFAGPFTKVVDTRASTLIAISRPITGPNGHTWMGVGEYNSGIDAPGRKLRWTFDGGQTWSVIFTMTIRDTSGGATNAHVHCSEYDPVMKRLRNGCGDNKNAFFGWAPVTDAGVVGAWTGQPTPPANPLWDSGGNLNGLNYQQPTVISTVKHRTFVAPDRGSFDTGVWEVQRRTGYTTVKHVVSTADPFKQFARGPFARDGEHICYWQYPLSVAETDSTFVAATGDAGRTWHTVYTRSLNSGADTFTQGIVGVDRNDKLYICGSVGGVTGVLVAPKLAWAA